MNDEPQGTTRRSWIIRFWRFFWSASGSVSLGLLLSVGFVAGNLFWGGFHWAVESSNSEEFCISCHEMRDNPYEEMKESIHFLNRSGARAVCSDCHVPRDWAHKIGRKIAATTNELPKHFLGVLDTPEKYANARLSMASSVWRSMKTSDSRECRNCHSEVWMDMSKQFGAARRAHEFAIENGNGLTCIDCHQGIAHKLPEDFKAPTNEQLAEDSEKWLVEMEALAAAGG